MAWIGSAAMAAAGAVALFCVAAPSTSDFLTTAMQTNLAEVRIGQLAELNGSPRIRDYAKMLVKDHTEAEQKTEALAKSLGVAVAGGPDNEAKSEYDKLSRLTGADFDAAFTESMINGHKKAIDLFSSETASTDAKVVKFAAEALPTLKQHLQAAQVLHNAMIN